MALVDPRFALDRMPAPVTPAGLPSGADVRSMLMASLAGAPPPPAAAAAPGTPSDMVPFSVPSQAAAPNGQPRLAPLNRWNLGPPKVNTETTDANGVPLPLRSKFAAGAEAFGAGMAAVDPMGDPISAFGRALGGAAGAQRQFTAAEETRRIDAENRAFERQKFAEEQRIRDEQLQLQQRGVAVQEQGLPIEQRRVDIEQQRADAEAQARKDAADVAKRTVTVAEKGLPIDQQRADSEAQARKDAAEVAKRGATVEEQGSPSAIMLREAQAELARAQAATVGQGVKAGGITLDDAEKRILDFRQQAMLDNGLATKDVLGNLLATPADATYTDKLAKVDALTQKYREAIKPMIIGGGLDFNPNAPPPPVPSPMDPGGGNVLDVSPNAGGAGGAVPKGSTGPVLTGDGSLAHPYKLRNSRDPVLNHILKKGDYVIGPDGLPHPYEPPLGR